MTRSVSPTPSTPPAAPALWQQLCACADAVAAVRRGASLNDALSQVSGHLRPGVQALSFTVLRQLGLAQALRGRLVPKAPAAWVDALLLSALALAQGTAYTPHTLVDQAVEAAKRRARPASGMVNAVLRRYLRERDELLAALSDDPVARYNHPRWWIERLQRDWPDAWTTLLDVNQHAAPMTLRANVRVNSPADYLTRLHHAGLAARMLDGGALQLEHPVPVQRLPGWDDGAVSVQDAAAQRAAPLLLQAGGHMLPARSRVLDACAAPGGKTAHLLELADVDVLALDADPARAERIDDTLKRLQLQATVRAADASQPATWWDGQPFDAILLDAPCSASGIVRRHPDVRWLRRDSDIDALARTQDALLQALWPTLKPGGHLLYCTCSLFKAEGQARIDAFLQRTPDVRLLPSPGHMAPVVEYPGSPPLEQGDGFFYALIRKLD